MQAITGILIKKYPIQQITTTFSKVEFVLKTAGDYPQEVLLQLTQGNCAKLDGFNIGDTITAQFNLRGRGHVGKDGAKRWYNSIEAWKLDGSSGSVTAEPIQGNDDFNEMPF